MIDVSAIDLSALLPFILVGFAAQMVDGALGMAYGVITSTLLTLVVVPVLYAYLDRWAEARRARRGRRAARRADRAAGHGSAAAD